MSEFTLKPDALHWQIGRRGGSVRYDSIRAVRLSYRPVTMQSHRFVTEIWAAGLPKLQIVSVSWRSVVSQERLDGAYRTFIVELHRRLHAAAGGTEFRTGLPFMSYWIGVVLFTAVLVAGAMVAFRVIWIAEWGVIAMLGLFLAMFAYQIGNYFFRNRPVRYQATSIPAAVLPAAVKD
jgi:hypothetical protein